MDIYLGTSRNVSLMESPKSRNADNIHTMKYSSALEGKEGLQYATWVNLENITLSKISQTEKDKYWMVPFI